MNTKRPVGYADLVCVLFAAKNNEEAEGMAKALGFEKRQDEKRQSENKEESPEDND